MTTLAIEFMAVAGFLTILCFVASLMDDRRPGPPENWEQPKDEPEPDYGLHFEPESETERRERLAIEMGDDKLKYDREDFID